MEILKSIEIIGWPNWVHVAFVLSLIGVIVTMILFVNLKNSSSEGYCLTALISFLLTITLVFTVVIGAKKEPTGKYTYTISITEPAVYKELIDKGYKISEPLYDGMNIYEITGDPLQ